VRLFVGLTGRAPGDGFSGAEVVLATGEDTAAVAVSGADSSASVSSVFAALPLRRFNTRRVCVRTSVVRSRNVTRSGVAK
jgi:hypothetical protein